MPNEKKIRNELIVQFYQKGLRQVNIAKPLSISRERVRQIIKKNGLPSASDRQEESKDEWVKGTKKHLHCVWCGDKFLKPGSGKVYYCSKKCYKERHKRAKRPKTCYLCHKKFYPFRNAKYYKDEEKKKRWFCTLDHYDKFRKLRKQLNQAADLLL